MKSNYTISLLLYSVVFEFIDKGMNRNIPKTLFIFIYFYKVHLLVKAYTGVHFNRAIFVTSETTDLQQFVKGDLSYVLEIVKNTNWAKLVRRFPI